MAERLNVLITGGAGYIGSVLTPTLLDAGHRVTVLDNLSFGQMSLLPVVHRQDFEFVRGDARDARLIADLIPRFDVLIPLVALVGAPACDKDPRLATELNLEAVASLLKVRSRQQRILFPNTNSGYGSQPELECTEETPFAPISHYGRTKVEAEQMLMDAGGAISFRLATAFGASPRQRLDLLVNDFVRQAVQEGVLVLFESGFRRNFIHVRDIAGVFTYGIEHFDTMGGRIFNVGLSDANLSKRELAERIQAQVPSLKILESEIGRDPDQRDYIVSNERIEATGWRPRYSLDDGIAELIQVCRMLPASPWANI